MLDKTELLTKTKEQVNEKRFIHIQGVVETAIQLAKQVGADPHKAEIAAILHDYCKFWSPERLKELLKVAHDEEWLEYPSVLWHAPAAVYVARAEFGIDDPDILNAIYYHTTGRPKMSVLEKVLWIADYIEPSRDFPGVDKARQLAKVNLDACMQYGLSQTIRYLLEKELPIYPLTFEAYNYFIRTGGKTFS